MIESEENSVRMHSSFESFLQESAGNSFVNEKSFVEEMTDS
jgi:hypothetical protein